MKRFQRMAAILLCAAALCVLAPAAFAAKVLVNFDPNGGVCDTAVKYTNADGYLVGIPGASQKGYNFDGWYYGGTDEVTGAEIDIKVTGDTVFKQDTTVYAHWTANGGAAEVLPAEEEVDENNALTTFGLAAGSVLVVLLVSVML